MATRRKRNATAVANKQSNQPRKDVREEATALLEAGRFLPDEFKAHLFETKREYEIVYAGKERESDILANTMAVPLQHSKTFGAAQDSWINKLIFGDNLQVLKTLVEMKNRGELTNADGTPGVRVCYIDPPFASEREFRGGAGQAAYSDKVAGAEFIEFLRKRLIFIRELLADDGTLYVHLDWKKGHYIKVVLDEIFGPSNFRNEIVWWYYNKYQGNINRFPSNHDSIYVYGQGPNPLFNPLMEERDEPARLIQRVWDPKKKKLVNAKDARGRVMYVEKDDRRIDDVWRIPMLQPAGRVEEMEYPTQKPEAVISLAIAAASSPGDLFLDAFMGSGSGCVAAEKLGRRWIGIDCGKLAVYVAQKKLLKLGADKRSLLTTSAFALYNAGLYDYKLLRDLSWAEFKSFALDLFQCKSEPHVIGKVELDGSLRSDPVLVFDFHQHKQARLDESFIEDLHAALGDRIGRRFFIIAPAASVDFLQDYIELEGSRHPVRYYVLRIPYSVIDEIHLRGFSRLQQPISERNVNDTVDAVGFDFIQPPTVKATYSRSETELKIQIKAFQSEAMLRNGSKPEGLAALAMVMVDVDHDGSIFDHDHVWYAEELAEQKYLMKIPSQSVGQRLMIIYIDVYGNEHREVKRLSDFRKPTRRK